VTKCLVFLRRKFRTRLILYMLPVVPLLAAGRAVLAGDGCQDSVPSPPCQYVRTNTYLCTVNIGFIYPWTLWNNESCTAQEWWRPSPYQLYWTNRSNCSTGSNTDSAYDQDCNQS
jgi:hypothetical protein